MVCRNCWPSAFSSAPQVLERRRLLQPAAHVHGDQRERRTEQERHPPPPGQHRLLRQTGGQPGDQGRTDHVPGERADGQEAGHHPAATVWGVLADVGHRAHVLPAGGEALHHPADQQQDRRPDAQTGAPRAVLAVTGQQTGDRGGHTHRHDGEGEHPFAADPVAERSEHEAAERSDRERDGQDAERAEERSAGPAGEEHLGDGGGQVGVDAEVVPLHEVPDRGAADGPAHLAGVGDLDVLQLPPSAPGFVGGRLSR